MVESDYTAYISWITIKLSHTQIASSSGVVIMDIGLNHLHKIPLAGEPPAVIALSFQNAPEALHRTVINAMCHAGHTLHHSSLHELMVESAAGILKTSVADDLNSLFLRGVPSLLHVASAS